MRRVWPWASMDVRVMCKMCPNSIHQEQTATVKQLQSKQSPSCPDACRAASYAERSSHKAASCN
jgi:hypothetical protein